jgi:hypothetical protein
MVSKEYATGQKAKEMSSSNTVFFLYYFCLMMEGSVPLLTEPAQKSYESYGSGSGSGTLIFTFRSKEQHNYRDVLVCDDPRHAFHATRQRVCHLRQHLVSRTQLVKNSQPALLPHKMGL